jgi:hypothetical protein
MPMKIPPHPGGFVLRRCIEPLGWSITNAAAAAPQAWEDEGDQVMQLHGLIPLTLPSRGPRWAPPSPPWGEGKFRPVPPAYTSFRAQTLAMRGLAATRSCSALMLGCLAKKAGTSAFQVASIAAKMSTALNVSPRT